MVLGLYLFENSFLIIVTITFTSLIISELLNVLSSVFLIKIILVSSL